MSEGVESATMLEPGQVIRPDVSEDLARQLVFNLYGLKTTSIKELNSYDDKNFYVKVEADYANEHIASLWPHGYMLKVLNRMDSQKTHVDGEHALQRHIQCKGFICPQPVLNKNGADKSLEKIYVRKSDNQQSWAENNDDTTEPPYTLNIVRLLTFIPGKILFQVPYTPSLFYKAGKYVGALDNALQGFYHDGYAGHMTIWNLASVPKLSEFVYTVRDEANRQLANDVIAAFSREVIPNMDQFKKGIIHGDFNEQNIIVQPAVSGDRATDRQPVSEDNNDGDTATDLHEEEYDIYAVIDFGDSLFSYFVFETAITICYMMIESRRLDPMLAGGHVLAGYSREVALNDAEFDALKVCVASRFATSLVMGEYTYFMDPGNEYVLTTAKRGWPILRELWNTPKEELYRSWRDIIESYNK